MYHSKYTVSSSGPCSSMTSIALILVYLENIYLPQSSPNKGNPLTHESCPCRVDPPQILVAVCTVFIVLVPSVLYYNLIPVHSLLRNSGGIP